VKRKKFLQHLRQHGCEVVGEGGDHTRVSNPANGNRTSLPRHGEINPHLCRKICRQLDVPPPTEK
jgi:predicted RNA binding protein YcfA (HicA-like mRNA interferase family)